MCLDGVQKSRSLVRKGESVGRRQYEGKLKENLFSNDFALHHERKEVEINLYGLRKASGR